MLSLEKRNMFIKEITKKNAMPSNAPEKNYSEALLTWRAPEFEVYERDQRWYTWASIALLAVIAFAVYTNSPVMAITFILIGMIGYIYIHKEPRELEFQITRKGVVAGREIYEFKNIESFWIFYEPGEITTISLDLQNSIIPLVHIPIADQDPVKLREVLLKYIPEVEQEHSLIDILERLLHI